MEFSYDANGCDEAEPLIYHWTIQIGDRHHQYVERRRMELAPTEAISEERAEPDSWQALSHRWS
jgi:hypothetical protein